MSKAWRVFLIVVTALQAVIVATDLIEIFAFGEMPPQRRIVHMEIGTMAAYVMWARLTWRVWERRS